MSVSLIKWIDNKSTHTCKIDPRIAGGTIKPRTRAYLAIPIDRSVKGKYPREYGGELFVVRKNEDGPRGRAYLATTVGKRGKAKMRWVLKKSVYQRPRPWWPDEMEIEQATRRFFEENF